MTDTPQPSDQETTVERIRAVLTHVDNPDPSNDEVVEISGFDYWTLRHFIDSLPSSDNSKSAEGSWRVGRKLGRTLYVDDAVVGMVDTAELARSIVDAMNSQSEGAWEPQHEPGACGRPSCMKHEIGLADAPCAPDHASGGWIGYTELNVMRPVVEAAARIKSDWEQFGHAGALGDIVREGVFEMFERLDVYENTVTEDIGSEKLCPACGEPHDPTLRPNRPVPHADA